MNSKNKLPFFGLPKIIPYLKKYRRSILIMIIGSTVRSGMDILIPVFQRWSLNRFVGTGQLKGMGIFIICYIATIAICALANFFSCRKAIDVEVGVHEDLRNAAFSHLQTLSFSYFSQNSVGYIHSRVMSDTERIGTMIAWSLMDAMWYSFYLVGAIAVMLVLNWRLALLVMLVLPLLALFFAIFEHGLIKVNRDIREINSRITGNFNEGITGAKTIKNLVIEDKIGEHFVAETTNMRRRSVKSAHLRGLFIATMNFASSVALAIVLWKGGVIAADQVGTFSLFMSYAQGMMEPVRWLVDVVSTLVTTQVNIERFTKLMETRSDVCDSPEVIEKYGDSFEPKKENWEELQGDIEFEDVSFKYPNGDEYILEHFNLKIPFGSNIAIVGETGAGKSTLVNLICRFYEPTAGRLLIDGRDARERSQLWLHSKIGYVLQSPQLFSGTVRDNLLYGNPNADEEQIRQALELVSASEVVERLEKGLDTDVGEGGDLLSSGEKQLISFARAILAQPRILVLDEATASVDTITEQKIQAAIGSIIKGRTSIVIAHRLSTVKNADLILVVRDGKIIEQGRHRELMAKRGSYFRLYTRQYEEEAASSVFSGDI